MVSKKDEDQGMVSSILHEHRENARSIASLREDGKVTVKNYGGPAKSQILSYLLGAAYSKVGNIREDDGVDNQELIEELKMNEGTARRTLKELRDEGLIVQKKEGLHRVEYKKLPQNLKTAQVTKLNRS